MTIESDDLVLPLKWPLLTGIILLTLTLAILYFVNAKKRENQLTEVKQNFCSLLFNGDDFAFIYEIQPDLPISEEKEKTTKNTLDNLVTIKGSLTLVFDYKNALWSVKDCCSDIVKRDGKEIIRPEWLSWQSLTNTPQCEAYQSDSKFSIVRSIITKENRPIVLVFEQWFREDD